MSQETRSHWTPVLQGESADQARRIVDDIAAALRDSPANAEAEAPDLATGRAGIALFFGYLYRAFGHDEDLETASALIDEAIASVGTQPMSDGLYGGFSGIAWVVQHLSDLWLDADDEDPCEQIDAAIARTLARSPWRRTYDLINGLAGLGVYTLERLPRPAARDALVEAVLRLAELAEHTDAGVTWFTEARLLSPWQQQTTPRGHYNLGLAHGVPAAVVVLASAVAADIATATARPLLDGAVQWLMAHRLDDSEPCTWDSWMADGARPDRSRSAWCHGDPGTAAAIQLAGHLVQESAWQEFSAGALRKVAVRPPENAGMFDTHLCHGATGLAHMFSRAFYFSNDAAFADAARLWLVKAMGMRRQDGAGVAGFPAFHREDKQSRWVDDAGFLSGTAGVGLALLAAITPVEPAWDRLLMLSAAVPPATDSSAAENRR